MLRYYYSIGYMHPDDIPVPPVELDLTPIMTANNLPAPYVASASSFIGGGETYRAFDKSGAAGSAWVANGVANGTTIQWISIDLNTPAIATMIKINSRNDANYIETPRDFAFEGSNDNTNWTEVYRSLNNKFTTLNEQKVYRFNNNVAYRYYRLYIRNNNGSGSNCSMSEFALWNNDEVSLRDTFVNLIPVLSSGTQNGITVTALGNATGEQPFRAFNGHTADVWAHVVATNTWLKVDFGAGNSKTVARYRMHSRTTWATQLPKDFKLQGSNDDAVWTDLDTRTGIVYTTSEKKEFVVASPQPFRYYRLFSTINGGDSATSIAQLELSAI